METSNIKIRANTPYPEITNATNDPRTVLILKDLMSSREGELLAILQYVFQSGIARQIDNNIADILEEIAVVEMEHLEVLRNAIIEFGGVPKYDNSKGQAFNTNYINYSTKLKDMLDANIQGEEQAIKNYTNAQMMVNNQSLKNLFARILEDEQLHLNVFKTLRNTVSFLSL